MAKVNIGTRSRLAFANLVEVDGRIFWDLPLVPKIEPQPDDDKYPWDALDTPEAVSNKRYGRTDMFWVIARRNLLFDLPGSLKTGDVIMLPSRRYAFEVLFGKR